jgi:predicted metalloprotease with PDZ domain
VQWDGPAFQSALTVGTKIASVDGVAFAAEKLKEAIGRAKGAAAPIVLTVKDGDQERTVRIDYHDGLRYPHLERDVRAPARLDEIFSPK